MENSRPSFPFFVQIRDAVLFVVRAGKFWPDGDFIVASGRAEESLDSYMKVERNSTKCAAACEWSIICMGTNTHTRVNMNLM